MIGNRNYRRKEQFSTNQSWLVVEDSAAFPLALQSSWCSLIAFHAPPSFRHCKGNRMGDLPTKRMLHLWVGRGDGVVSNTIVESSKARGIVYLVNYDKRPAESGVPLKRTSILIEGTAHWLEGWIVELRIMWRQSNYWRCWKFLGVPKVFFRGTTKEVRDRGRTGKVFQN